MIAEFESSLVIIILLKVFSDTAISPEGLCLSEGFQLKNFTDDSLIEIRTLALFQIATKFVFDKSNMVSVFSKIQLWMHFLTDGL